MRRIIVCVCVGIACLLFVTGAVFGRGAKGFAHSVTLQADETGFDADTVRQMQKQENMAYSFAAWRECADQTVLASESGRRGTGVVIELCGPSRCILPYGKNLSTDQKDGCLLGTHLAEELFGSHRVEGQKVQYKDKELTVCGVIETPDDLMICETLELEEGETFDRISIFLTDASEAYRTGQKFVSQSVFNAQMLRFDFYRDLSWMLELVPGKWSNFSGWRINLEKKQQEICALVRAEKSAIEVCYINELRKRNLCWMFGVISLGVGALLIFYAVRKRRYEQMFRFLTNLLSYA